jgi:hypothetical protein
MATVSKAFNPISIRELKFKIMCSLNWNFTLKDRTIQIKVKRSWGS